jgi:phosphoglycolate phosphatase-like HAD superfamily hydrolase
MTRTPRLAWLFDVDGTLLLTEGAAREAFARTVREVLGVDDDLRDIAFAGRTEPLILGDILAAHGRTLSCEDEARFWNVVFGHMRRLLGPNRGRLLPGVLPLLDAIAREPAWILGLLTGNMTEMAAIKLQRFGIAGHFSFGAYGEMAEDRNALACLAVERVTRAFGLPAERCIVVGDTEHDVACARAAGAHVVAVATGSRRRDELEAHAPDLVLADLSDAGALLEWARDIEREPMPRSSGSRRGRPAP